MVRMLENDNGADAKEAQMGKLRSDSKWNELTDEQRDTLEGWLFEENISYRDALDRLQKEFGITVGMTSLARFYQHLADKRMKEELLQAKQTAMDVEGTWIDGIEFGNAAMTLVTKRLIQVAVEKPNNTRELVSLARVIVANEEVEVKKAWLAMEQDRQMEIAAKKDREKKLHQAWKPVYDAIFQDLVKPKAAASPEAPANPPVNGQNSAPS